MLFISTVLLLVLGAAAYALVFRKSCDHGHGHALGRTINSKQHGEGHGDGQSAAHVLLSFAPEQKEFANLVKQELHRLYSKHIQCVLEDGTTMHMRHDGFQQPGSNDVNAMQDALIAVAIMSKEYVRSAACMHRLDGLCQKWQAAVGQHAANPEHAIIPIIMPVFYRVEFDDMMRATSPIRCVWLWRGLWHCPWLAVQHWMQYVSNGQHKVVAKAASVTVIRQDQYLKDTDRAKAVVKMAIKQLRTARKMPLGRLAPPAGLPAHLVGQQHHEALSMLQQYKMLIVHGRKGIGKSTIAKTVYEQLRTTSFANSACCYLRLGPLVTLERLHEQQRHIMSVALDEDELQAAGPHSPSSWQEGRPCLQQHLTGKKMLLVVDIESTAVELVNLLPRNILANLSPGSLVLVTSAQADAVMADFPGCAQYDVRPLLQDEAASLVCHHFSGGSTVGRSEIPPAGDVNKVVEVCLGLPLVVTKVAEFMGQNNSMKYWREPRRALEECDTDQTLD